MKRFFLLGIICVLTFCSCEKEKQPSLPELSNTVWAAKGDDGADDDYRQVLNFYDDSNVAYYPYYASSGTQISSIPSYNCYKGTYEVLSNTEVSFNLVRTHDFGIIKISYVYTKGVINGNTMTVTQTSSNGNTTSYVYTKQ